jgi:hypothetical protein
VIGGVTEKRMGSVSPALSRWKLRLGGLERPAGGEFELDRALGGGLGVDRDADRQGAAVERQNAGLGIHADADGGRDDQRLVDAAGTGDALHGLHHLADADGQAVEGELRPGGERPRREGALAVFGVGEVVVGLLDVGAGEVGLGGLGVVGTWGRKMGRW